MSNPTEPKVFWSPGNRRKKLRGQRRRFRMLEEWKQSYLKLEIEFLKEHHSIRARVPNAFWIDSQHKTSAMPPHSWQRWLVNAMLEIHASWKRQLEELGEPYFLEIRIQLPNFQDASIIASFRDRLYFYGDTQQPKAPSEYELHIPVTDKPLPQHLETGGLQWKHTYWPDVYRTKSDDGWRIFDSKSLRRREEATFTTQERDGETWIWYYENHLWYATTAK
jgi:hypothetical protein